MWRVKITRMRVQITLMSVKITHMIVQITSRVAKSHAECQHHMYDTKITLVRVV
jgi:hypothetical protein